MFAAFVLTIRVLWLTTGGWLVIINHQRGITFSVRPPVEFVLYGQTALRCSGRKRGISAT